MNCSPEIRSPYLRLHCNKISDNIYAIGCKQILFKKKTDLTLITVIALTKVANFIMGV